MKTQLYQPEEAPKYSSKFQSDLSIILTKSNDQYKIFTIFERL